MEMNFKLQDLPRVIRIMRKSAGMTQSQLADKVGVSISNISLLERGKRKMSIGKFIEIVDACNYSIEMTMKNKE